MSRPSNQIMNSGIAPTKNTAIQESVMKANATLSSGKGAKKAVPINNASNINTVMKAKATPSSGKGAK